jgi:acyl-CoA thioester hydrolase
VEKLSRLKPAKPQTRVIGGETMVRVRYAETDKMGVVYHSNFVIWFEVGRVELMRQHGFQYRDLEREDNCHIAVVDMHIRYKAPAFYDDEIVIRTRLTDVRQSRLQFHYEIVRAADQKLLAEGETTHLVVNDKLERRSLPKRFLDAFTLDSTQ